MGTHFFDFNDGDFAFAIADRMAIDSEGNTMMRVGDTMAMDMNSGELHVVSFWDNDDGRDVFGSKHSLWDDE